MAKNRDEVLDFDVLDSMSPEEAAETILGKTPRGGKSKSNLGTTKLGKDKRNKQQEDLTKETMLEKGRKLISGNGWDALSKNTIRNIVLGDEEYKTAKRELMYLKAHAKDYADSEQYKESVEKLEAIVKYRAEVWANINSAKAKNERREARRNDPRVIELREKITILRAMEKYLKPYSVAHSFAVLTKELILDGDIVMPDADYIIDNDGMMDENQFMISKNKELINTLYNTVRELKSKPDFATTFLKNMAATSGDSQEDYSKYAILIYIILNSSDDKYTFENIMIMGNDSEAKLQKLVKENVDVFKSKYLKDDVGRDFDDKLNELEKERRIRESEVMSTRMGQFVHQKYNFTSEDIKEWETTGKMPKNLRQARELFTAEMIGNVYAIAGYMCHIKGMTSKEDVEDVAGAGTLVVAENLEAYLKEFLKTYEETGKFLSFNAFVGYKIFPEIQNAINNLRMMGMHGKTGNNFIYTMGVYKRLKDEMFREHPEYANIKDETELADTFEVYVARRISTDPKLEKMIGDFNKLNGANFGLSLDNSVSGDEDEKRTLGDVIPDPNPLPDELADFNMDIDSSRNAIKRFFTEIRYIHRYDAKNKLFNPPTSRGLFDESLCNYLSRRLGIVRDNPKTKSEHGVFAGYYDNDKDIAGKIGVTPATMSTYLNGKNNSFQDKLNDVINDLQQAANDYPQLSGYYRKLKADTTQLLKFFNKFVATSRDVKNADKRKRIEHAKMISLIAHLDITEEDISINKFNEKNFPSKQAWKPRK